MKAQRFFAAWLSKVVDSERQELTFRNVPHDFERRSAVVSWRWFIVAVVFILCSISHTQAAGPYSIIDLGDLPGGEDYSAGVAINSLGEVTGHSSSETGIRKRAFVWNRASGMRPLGDLAAMRSSIGYGINDAGAVVGDRTDMFAGRQQAFIWTNAGGMRDLDDVPGDFDGSQAVGVNNSGQAVGLVNGTLPNNLGFSRAVLWMADGTPMDLGDLPGGTDSSSAQAINDNGQVAGYSSSTGGLEAFIWTSGTGMQPLGDLPGSFKYSRPFAINAAGHVVGESDAARGRVAFLWSPAGGMVDLGNFPGIQHISAASDINSSGQVIGSASIPGARRAFLWTADGGMQDLTTLLDASGAGWNLESAGEINDAGQIVGTGRNPAGMTHAYLLTPVPEPATIALMVCGCLALAPMIGLARRRWEPAMMEGAA